MYLAENIKYLRKKKGLNQNELADELGSKRSTVGNWENKERTPDLDSIIKIAELFEVSLDELVLHKLKPNNPFYVENIKYLRKKHEMTQEDMANLLGYKGKQGYNALETGKAKPNVDDLEKLADFFGVTLDQLVKQDLAGGA